MAYSATQNASGTYDILNDGVKIATGTKDVADTYLSQNQAPAAAATPVVSPIQVNRSIDPTADAASAFLDSNFKTPETADQIAERKRQQSQALIDSINKQYDDQVAARQKLGTERVSANNAISVLSGLSGSTEAVRTEGSVKDANQKEIDAVNNQRAVALQTVYTKIQSDAEDEARQQLQDATKSAEDVLARRKDAQAQAVENLKAMAASGLVDFEAFKNNPENAGVYKYALDSVGGSEDALRGIFALNRPQDQVLDKLVQGNSYIQVSRNPITGKTNIETFKLPFDVPTDWKQADLGDRVMFYDPADPDNHKYYSKGLTPGQANPAQTQAQVTASGYAQRTSEANDVIAGLENTIASMSPLSYTGQVAAEGNSFTHGLASEDVQKLRQAERNFVNAVLRRESGAAISQSEFDNAEKQYFPQPGDTAATLAQKAQNRQTVIASLNTAAGASANASSAPSPGGAVYELDGVRYVQAADGKFYSQ